MSFLCIDFFLFFTIVVLGRYLLPDKLKRYWLLSASYFFYMSTSLSFAFLLLGGTVVGYFAALAIERDSKGRKLWLILGVGYTIAVLFTFKYLDFFCSSLWKLAGRSYTELGWVLPVGISFFSFSLSGYLFDVYRKKLCAEQSFVDFALFVSFFPCILAGPIGWARDFLPQLKAMPRFQPKRFRRGVLRFAFGAMEKMVLADTLSGFVDAVYAEPWSFSSGCTLLAALCYSLQIYFDFCGYSEMALGAADALGFDVIQNFRAPYLSTSVRSFWKKWHISLTSWFREYLYFPLGGSKKGLARTMLNIVIVFAVSGLWHGSAWTFIVWGLLNAVYQCVEMLSSKWTDQWKGVFANAVKAVFVFALLTVSWIFFRAPSIEQAVYLLKHILLLLRDGFGWASVAALFPLRQVLMLLITILPCIWRDMRLAKNKPLTLEQKPLLCWACILFLALLTCVFGVYGQGYDVREFIYFQF